MINHRQQPPSTARWDSAVDQPGHVPVHAGASPDDSALIDYWSERRRRRQPPPLDQHTLKLLATQRGRCPSCGHQLLDADDEPKTPHEWELWFNVARRTLRKQQIVQRTDAPTGERSFYRLVHTTCHRSQSDDAGTQRSASTGPPSPTRLA
jgi:RNA-directed DNA polymerase